METFCYMKWPVRHHKSRRVSINFDIFKT
ncbi:hypothetical protein [Escherichia coli]|nr:hypothetical protein [Escherichia coli]